MAKAIHNAPITETKVVEIEPESVTLVLSRQEAEAISAVLSKVAGYPNGTRGQAEAVLTALKAAGYNYEGTAAYATLSVTTSGLRFNDGERSY